LFSNASLVTRVRATDVLWWPEIVRYGLVAGNCQRWKPLDICYQPDFEEEIVEVVGSLTELGDLIGGNCARAKSMSS
jgi:hypothetical protein